MASKQHCPYVLTIHLENFICPMLYYSYAVPIIDHTPVIHIWLYIHPDCKKNGMLIYTYRLFLSICKAPGDLSSQRDRPL